MYLLHRRTAYTELNKIQGLPCRKRKAVNISLALACVCTASARAPYCHSGSCMINLNSPLLLRLPSRFRRPAIQSARPSSQSPLHLLLGPASLRSAIPPPLPFRLKLYHFCVSSYFSIPARLFLRTLPPPGLYMRTIPVPFLKCP